MAERAKGETGASGPPERFEYTPWRHGGWYVTNVRHPGGGSGCVSRNYPDGKWRIVCGGRPYSETFKTRDEAARAEWFLVNAKAKAGDQ